MAKEQIVGVVFLSTEDKARAEGGPCKEYLYKDTLGCSVGEIVVVEARDSVSLARVVAIYIDTLAINERPLRHVASKVESAYTKQQAAKRAKRERIKSIMDELETIHDGYSPMDLYAILALKNESVAELMAELSKLKEEVENA